MPKRLYFLYHERWGNDHAEPFLRYQKELNLECIPCPSNDGRPENLWPIFDDRNRVAAIKKIVDAIKNPLAVIVHHRCITQELIRRQIPLIILEHTDGTSLEISRYLISLPNVLGVIKGTRFVDKNYYNGLHCEGMFHGKFIKSSVKPSFPELTLPLDVLDKIELGYSFGCFPTNKRLVDRQVDFDANRSIDISFVGGTHYPRSRLITQHRTAAVEAVEQVGGLAGNSFPQGQFDDILLDSKLCLSPYGYGVCYRSFESLYAGCLTIQPNSDYLESHPNVYVKNQTYFECNADFSNLREIKQSILDHYNSFKDMRIDNRNMLIKHYFSDLLLEHLQWVIRKCLKRL